MPRYLPRALRDKRGQGSPRPDTDKSTDESAPTRSAATKTAAKTGTARAGARRGTARTAPSQRNARAANTSPADTAPANTASTKTPPSDSATRDITDDRPREETSPAVRRRPSPRRHDDDDTTATESGGTTRTTRPNAKAPARPGSSRKKSTSHTRARVASHGRRPRGKAANRAASQAATRRRLVVTAVVLGVLVALTGATAGTAWYLRGQAQQLVDAREGARAAAVVAAKAVFSYDYRSFDQSVNNGKDFVTGAFAKEYTKTTSGLKATAIKEKAIVWSDVAAASVSTATHDKVDVLLYVNQYRKNANITGQKVDQNRVVLTMVRVGQDWKVSAASAL